jgi:hypothetical protein
MFGKYRIKIHSAVFVRYKNVLNMASMRTVLFAFFQQKMIDFNLPELKFQLIDKVLV